MVAPEVQGIDLFKIAGRSISGWVPSLKTGTVVRQPFCSQLEERLLMWLEYHPLVKSYARGDIDSQFATTYRLPIPQHAPFAIGYTFENKPHHYLPDVVGTLANGKPFIAEAGMEDDKRGDRNLAKAEAARRLACLQQGTFWIGTERTLTKRRHYNLVFLHARRKTFPAFSDIAAVLPEVWPWGEMAEVAEVASRLSHQFPVDLVEAAIWKVVADAAAQGHLLLDLEQYTLSRTLPLALLPPDAPVLVPSPLPDTLLPESETTRVTAIERQPSTLIPGPTFDASTLPEPQRAQFHRNLRAVEQVLAGATQSSFAEKEGIPRSTLSRLVSRTRERGQIACVPHGSYRRATSLHPAFAECIRRLFGLPTRLTMTAIREHTEMQQVAARVSKETGTPVSLPAYNHVRTAVQHLSTPLTEKRWSATGKTDWSVVEGWRKHSLLKSGYHRSLPFSAKRNVTKVSEKSVITTISFDADGTLWDFPSVMQEALTVTDLQQTRDEVARTLRGNKVSLEYIRLQAFEQTLSNLGHNDPELASHLTTVYLQHRFPRDAQRVLPQQQSGLRAFFIASLFRGGGVKVTVTSRKVEPEERREPSSDLCIGK